MKKGLVILIAALFLLAACSSDDETTSPTALTSGDLKGTWAPDCVADDNNGDGVDDYSWDFTLTFGTGSGNWAANSYRTVTDCSGTVDQTEAGDFTFTLGSTVITLATSEYVTPMYGDDTVQTVTYKTQAAVDEANASGEYGYNDWTLGVWKDTLGKNGDGSTYTDFTFQDIVYIDTAATPNTLQMGVTEWEGGTVDEDGYPTALSTEIFEKQ